MAALISRVIFSRFGIVVVNVNVVECSIRIISLLYVGNVIRSVEGKIM